MGFAQDYWKDFEELSIDLIKLLFKDYHFDKHIEKTQNSKDGGYDGVVLISDNEHNVYKAISESKLRKLSRKDLPLSDFAKTLIISVNLCADKVYIFTNLHFSNETQNRIEKFSRGTNIKVQLFDIVEIVGLIPKLADDILKNYPTEFIEKLQNSVTDHPRKLSLNPAPKINLKKECELLGIEREKQFAETVQNIDHKTGIYIICGRQGSGKSFFIDNLILKLHPTEYEYIDIAKIPDVNTFFIYLLSIIWHVDILTISHFSTEDICKITDYITDDEEREKLKDILSKILVNNCLIEMDAELVQFFLLRYLDKIYTPMLKHKNVILIFQNLEYASSQIQNFLLKFLKQFYDRNILLLLEIRDEHIVLQEFLSKCQSEIKIIGTTKLQNLSKIDTKIYIKKKYGKLLDVEQQEKFVKLCPRVPLYIDQIIDLLKRDVYGKDVLCNDTFFYKHMYENWKYTKGANEEYIKRVLSDCCDETKICTVLIAFMDGNLKLTDLSYIFEDKTCREKVMEELVKSQLFIIGSNSVETFHISILDALRRISESAFKKHAIKAYKKLWENMDLFDEIPKRKEKKKFKLALELDEIDYIQKNWKGLSVSYLADQEYDVVIPILEKIYEKYYESLDNSNKYQLFIYLLQSYVCINEFGEKIELCIDELETFTLSAEANCDFLFWKAKYYLVKGDYEKITKELNNYIKEDPRLYYMYALGIKHLYGIDKCIEELNAAQILYPDNWLIKYSYYDHNLSKVFKTDIKLAVEYIRQMQVFTSKLSLEDFFHYEYNKLVVAFYNKQLKSSQELEYLMQNCYKNNLSVEQSRVCNLLGQFYWCNNDIKKAIHYFEIGKMIQHQTDHHTYWWISNTNLALLYFEQNRYDECLQSINCIVNKYCENKWKKIVRFFSQKNIISSQLIDDKEITSFMLILWIAYSIDKEEGHRIIQSINLQNSTSLHQAYFDLNFLDNFVNGTLNQTNYFFESHYMIKC